MNLLTRQYENNFQEREYLYKIKPWKNQSQFFHKCKISLLVLTKMNEHALRGKKNQVMGLLCGTFNSKGEFIIVDCYALPVQASQTRVTSEIQAQNFRIIQNQIYQRQKKPHITVGWYHSHPSYGCWLSKIDVQTQKRYQNLSDPWIAIVIDPERTLTRGKIQLGAFRCFEDNQITSNQNFIMTDIPSEKIAEFGSEYKKYYQLKVTIFRNQFDQQIIKNLQSKEWINLLSNSQLIFNKEYFQKGYQEVMRQGKKKKQQDLVIHLVERNRASLKNDFINMMF